jgi:hypothetical protein
VRGRPDAIGPLRTFRFPDALVWVLIVGLGLLVLAGWTSGAGRLGGNLAALTGALFALRGAAVFLVLTGGVRLFGGLLLVVGMVLAAPVLLTGAMALGLGDAWFDLRSRAGRNAVSGPE